MSPRLPNLFRSEERSEALKLYQMFLTELECEGRYEEVVAACRRIRRMAPTEIDAKWLAVFFMIEIHVLAELGRYGSAWMQLRRFERTQYGSKLDLVAHQWSIEETPTLIMTYVPLLYFLKRYKLGCALLEETLQLLLRHGGAYHALQLVARAEYRRPTSIHDVTLTHFYARLNRELNDWKDWRRLIDGIDQELLSIATIDRDELRSDPALLPVLCKGLESERRRRHIVAVDRGQADLLESPEQVRREQEKIRQQMAEAHQRLLPNVQKSKEKIQRYFRRFLP